MSEISGVIQSAISVAQEAVTIAGISNAKLGETGATVTSEQYNKPTDSMRNVNDTAIAAINQLASCLEADIKKILLVAQDLETCDAGVANQFTSKLE